MPKPLKQHLEPLKDLVQTDIPTVTVTQNREAIVEGCTGILSYSENEIQLHCQTLVLHVNGFDLQVTRLSNGFVSIRGTLLELSFSAI